MISRKIVKSNASKVQPSQAATQASHWSLVGSFHQGMLCTVSIAAMVFLPRQKRLSRWNRAFKVKVNHSRGNHGEEEPALAPLPMQRQQHGRTCRSIPYSKLAAGKPARFVLRVCSQ